MAGTIARLFAAGVAAGALAAVLGPTAAAAQEQSAPPDAGDLSLSEAEWARRNFQWAERLDNALNMYERAIARCDIAAMNRSITELAAIRDELRRAARGLKALGDDRAGYYADSYLDSEDLIRRLEAKAARNCGSPPEPEQSIRTGPPPTPAADRAAVDRLWNAVLRECDPARFAEIKRQLIETLDALAGQARDSREASGWIEQLRRARLLEAPACGEGEESILDEIGGIPAPAEPVGQTPSAPIETNLPADYGVDDRLETGPPNLGPMGWAPPRPVVFVDPFFGLIGIPGTTAGVIRNEAGDELPAGTCTGKLDIFGVGAGLRFPAGGAHVFVEGQYSEADGKTCPFTVEPGSVSAAGFSFGEEAGDSTGLILGDYAGETSSILTDQNSISIKAGVQIPIGEALPWPVIENGVRLTIEPFVQYEHRETDFDSHVAMVTNLPDFKPDISQERRQIVGDDHYIAGIKGNADISLGRNTILVLSAVAAADLLHTSLDSVEHDHCSVCTGPLEDFTLETSDSADDLRFRGGLGAALEFLVSPDVSITVGAAADVIPIGSLFNPVTGDDVLDGDTTRLGETDEVWRRTFFGTFAVAF